MLALVPLVLLFVLLAVFRLSAWQAVIVGVAVTIILAITVWNAPTGSTFKAWAIGAGTGIWSIDWITFWGVIIYSTLVETYSVGGLLKMPPLLLPALNSVGAEIGKPVAPQTASVGVSTSQFVRKEGEAIRHNLGWTLILLGYLILIALLYYYVLPSAMQCGYGRWRLRPVRPLGLQGQRCGPRRPRPSRLPRLRVAFSVVSPENATRKSWGGTWGPAGTRVVGGTQGVGGSRR